MKLPGAPRNWRFTVSPEWPGYAWRRRLTWLETITCEAADQATMALASAKVVGVTGRTTGVPGS